MAWSLLLGLAYTAAAWVEEPSSPWLQPWWSWMGQWEGVRNCTFTGTLMTATFIVACCYFSVLDCTRARSKIQDAYWPSLGDMLMAALPQLALYLGSETIAWTVFWNVPQYRCPLPRDAPTLATLAWEVCGTLIVGDFLIYWEHRMMHAVPWVRNTFWCFFY